MICELLWFGGGGDGGGWCCVFFFFFPSILLCFNGGGGGGGLDGWLLVVGLSFSDRWLLALVGCWRW